MGCFLYTLVVHLTFLILFPTASVANLEIFPVFSNQDTILDIFCKISTFSMSASWTKGGTTLTNCGAGGFCSTVTDGNYTYTSNSTGINVRINPYSSIEVNQVWTCTHSSDQLDYRAPPKPTGGTDMKSTNLLPLLTLLVLLCIPIAAFLLWWKFRHQGQILNNYIVDCGEKIELLSSSLSEYKTRIISVKWIVNGEPVPKDENYLGGNKESPTLVISRAALHDAGMYKCVLELQDEQEETVITAHLDVIVYTGDKVCLLENILVTDAIQTVQWMHEQICLSVDDHLFYKGGTNDCPSLTITNLTLNDAGNYTCRITFNDSSSRTFPVKLIVHEKIYTTDAGGTIKLLKSIKKNSDVDSVEWLFKGQNISTVDSPIYQGGNKDCPPLTISLVDSTDEGTYQCSVIFKNKEERHITVKLRVNVQEYKARTGGSMILLPQLSRNAFTQVTWTDASGIVINADERITSAEIANGAESSEVSRFSGGSIECPSLAINKITEADSQEYHCQLLFADQSSRTIKVILSVGGERFTPLPPIGNSTNNTVSSKY